MTEKKWQAPEVGDVFEVIWLGQVRQVLHVTTVYDSHWRANDGSLWWHYGLPYQQDPWGVSVRYAGKGAKYTDTTVSIETGER